MQGYIVEVENRFGDRLFYASLGVCGHTFTSGLNGDYLVLFYGRRAVAQKAFKYVKSIRRPGDVVRIVPANMDRTNGKLSLRRLLH